MSIKETERNLLLQKAWYMLPKNEDTPSCLGTGGNQINC